MKKPKLLTILMKFYSFHWLRFLSLPFRFFSFHVSKKFISISYTKKSNESPSVATSLPALTSATQITGTKFHSSQGVVAVQKTYFVYILRSLKNKKFYIGTTDDLYACVEKHNTGKNIQTIDYFPFELIYYEAYIYFEDAKNRETYLRSNAGQQFLKKNLRRFFHAPQKPNVKKILRVVSYISTIVLIILIPTLIAIFYSPKPSIAAWFNESWAYRTAITITHNASDTNKKVKFDIDTRSGASETLEGKIQSDCGDSRFTDSNGNLLPYYIDTAGGACNGSSTDYYVLIPVINNGTTVIYHYYGNPRASNGTQTEQLPYETLTPSTGTATATEELGPGPVMYLKFDEGANNTCSGGTNDVCDSTLNRNDGAATEAVWRSEDMCISGMCLWFDGSNDVVTVNNANTIDFDLGLNDGFTFSAWVKPAGAGEGSGGQIFFKGTNTWLRVDTLSNGRLDLQASMDLATTDATLNVSSAIPINQWNHIALSYSDDSDDELTIWVNGQAIGTSSDGNGAPVASDGNNFLIAGTTTANFTGFIDDVKIYPYERTTGQLKGDATRGRSTEGSSAIFGATNNNYLTQGLAGYWRLDEVSGNASDSVGGTTLTNVSTTAYTGAKFGRGMEPDGTADYFQASDNAALSITGSLTLSAWINPDDTTGSQDIIGKWDGANESYLLAMEGANLRLYIDVSTTYQETTSTPITANMLQHVAGVYDATNRTIKLYVNGIEVPSTTSGSIPTSIGDDGGRFHLGAEDSTTAATNFYDGHIDDARVYNRALTAGEIRQLSAWNSGPILYYTFEEGSGGTVYDRSGFENGNLTLNARTSFDFGKFGKALSNPTERDDVSGQNAGAQGTDDSDLDFVDGQDFTITAWVYYVSKTFFDDNAVIAGKHNCCTDPGYRLMIPSGTNLLEFLLQDNSASGNDVYTVTSSTDLPIGEWAHVAGVFDDDGGVNIYINGVLDTAAEKAGTLGNIGSFSGTPSFNVGTVFYDFGGKIDEVKVYNYARSSQQLMEDMNGGHPIGGSPVGSQQGYWSFDEMSGTTAYDKSSYTTNGTLTNAPTYTSGKVNGALDFESGDSEYVTVSDNTNLSATGSISISAWINPESNTAATVYPIATKGSPYALVQYGDEIRMYIGSLSNYETTDAVNLSTGTWYHVVGRYNSTTQQVTIYVNGQEKDSTTTGTIPASIIDSGSSFDIGRFTYETSVEVSQSSDDARQSGSTVVINNATLETDATTELLGFRFNNIAINQAQTIQSAFMNFWVTGSGTDEPNHPITGDDADDCATFTTGSNDISARADTTASSTWSNADLGAPGSFNTASLTTVAQEIVDRGGWVSGNDICFVITGTATATRDLTVAAQDDTSLPAPVFTYSTTAFSYFDGLIDEVQVYANSLTADQINILYNLNSATSFSVGQNEASTLSDGAGNPPIAYWNFDENKDNLCPGGSNDVCDKSGNGNDGAKNNMPISWVPGKISSALRFDGIDDRVQVGDVPLFDLTSGWTVSSWVQVLGGLGNYQDIIVKGDEDSGNDATFYLQANADSFFEAGFVENGSGYQYIPGTSTINLGSWYHVTGTFSNTNDRVRIYVNGTFEGEAATTATPTTNANPLIIGAGTNTSLRPFNGMIDEVKIFDYEMTPAQVAYNYNRGAPVGWWKFDECQDDTANDASGNRYTGAISPGASGNTSVGTCSSGTNTHMWNDGAIGKLNASLDFDGTDDAVTLPPDMLDTQSIGSVCSWIYWKESTDNGTEFHIVSSADDSSGNTKANFYVSDTGSENAALIFYVRRNTVSNDYKASSQNGAIQRNTWQHVCATQDGGGVDLYVNAKQQVVTESADGTATTADWWDDVSSVTNNVTIGATLDSTPSEYFLGQIDDVRIYNYPLSQSQIMNAMNDTAGVRFGPSTGSP